MNALRLILADQLSKSIATLAGCDKQNDIIMLCEVADETSYVPHHPKKIAFLFSAMRHFAQSLREAGYRVHYVALDDPNNTGSFDGEIVRAVSIYQPARFIVTEPGEWRVLELLKQGTSKLSIPSEIRSDDRFLATHHQFETWADGKKQLRMEFFYREMRKQYNILMDGAKPVGGKWNFDKENRKPPKAGLASPPRISHKKSTITNDVLSLVRERFGNHFGDLEPFHFAVTAEQAQMECAHFIKHCLPQFGDYQDAMVAGEAYLYHSLISSYLNAGLLLPLDVCKQAEEAYHSDHAPLNAVEGFIRQILGWREFIRGIYWHFMPEYATRNQLNATRPLPDFYWGGNTDMFCIAETVRHTKEHAYSHHIQRLMVTGNFALLAGLSPEEVCAWYLAVYADAYEWVELPNTLGMALFGDGGIVGSKPYAASGKYINKMSNYCSKCKYNPNEATTEDACPFNALYWDFFARNEDHLRGNPRIPYVYNTWEKMGAEKQAALRAKAHDSLQRMHNGCL